MVVCFYRGTEYEDEFEMFLRGGETVLSGKPPRIDGLSPEQVRKRRVIIQRFDLIIMTENAKECLKLLSCR